MAKAMGCGTQISQTWESYDLLSPEGIKIEVKTSAYIQSWKQKAFSKISLVSPRQNFGMVLITWGKRNVMRTCMSLRAETHGSGDDQPSLELAQWDFTRGDT